MTRPEELKGETPRYKSKCGWLYVTINANEEGKVQEIFLRLGKQGCCARAWTQPTGELLSDFIKTSKVERIWKHFYGIECVESGNGRSCQQIIADALEPYCTDKEFIKNVKESIKSQQKNREENQ
jgi:hypothetical protein